MQALIAVLAVVAGILLGFWIRTVSTSGSWPSSINAIASLSKRSQPCKSS